ncbi:Asp-tRNA(Asn)/Glu-tRNA(Gln) amidotransferase subunit GatC [Candidatus Peregrinibacteria bacterium]|nr:Asp-tRNA(Asn)/Glu-tRNA(Gln) amidotransferase subunit GatC [Candidatus Peregrinibacteria bacterium]
MKLTSDEVKHIAKLARLELSDEEVKKFGEQLSGILSKAKMLEEIDTSKVEPIAQITGLKNVTYKDEVQSCDLADKLLEQSPMPIQDHMIKVKNVFND